MDAQPTEANYNKSLLLFIVILTSFINPFLSAAVNVSLPDLAKQFSLNAVTMGWVAMTYLLATAVFLVPMGKVADMVGRKRIFLIGNIVVTIATLFCGLALSIEMLLVFRVLQGIGGAMVFGTGMALITSAYPPHQRGKAIGISVTSVYVGLSIAPLLGGFLTSWLGWRSIYFVTLPVEIVIIFITLFAIKVEWAEARNERFDYTGSILYGIAISALIYGLSKLPDSMAIGISILGVLLLIVFVWFELNLEYPVLEIKLFKTNKLFAFSNLAAFINYAATFAIGFLLSLYLQYIKGLSPKEAGSVLVIQPIVMAVVAFFSGRMSDKIDPRILSSLGMGIIVIGLLLLTLISFATASLFIIISLGILGIGFGLFSSPNTNAIMGAVEKRYLGIASATVSTMRVTGQMISLGFATMVIHVFIGESKIIPSNYGLFLNSIKILFFAFSVLCILGVFASLARPGKKATL